MSVVKKQKKKFNEEDLDGFTKEELIDRVRQLIAHNKQLKNVISKKIQSESNGEGASKKERKFDFSKCSKRHIFLKLLYLGWDYQGFATQEDTNKTIEWELFEALKKSCLIDERATSNYHRCGRTDKGVSAFGQVISIDVRSRVLKQPENENCENTDEGVSVSNQEPLKPDYTSTITTESENIESELEYCKILNRLLPQQIRAIAWSPVSPEESARFNCRKRTYKYFFPRGNLNLKYDLILLNFS
ncbi:hypothetical protein J437_LFUL017241 [Ladona fulva]|uniref:tRNA pseudouridine synthase n=1 Tax=Ladona fulva TaxID=123851 RepID=A0A8K0KUA9_LADFU|nr:hypothetical protein J437_LFUL017241 [Ladona fulva]